MSEIRTDQEQTELLHAIADLPTGRQLVWPYGQTAAISIHRLRDERYVVVASWLRRESFDDDSSSIICHCAHQGRPHRCVHLDCATAEEAMRRMLEAERQIRMRQPVSFS